MRRTIEEVINALLIGVCIGAIAFFMVFLAPYARDQEAAQQRANTLCIEMPCGQKGIVSI